MLTTKPVQLSRRKKTVTAWPKPTAHSRTLLVLKLLSVSENTPLRRGILVDIFRYISKV